MNISNDSLSGTADVGDDDGDFSRRLAIIQGSIYIPIFCAGIVNNLLTISIMLLNREMYTVTNCYLLNLAISDTLPLIVSLPFEIPFLPITMPWLLGCKLRSLLAETSTNASILTISAFTVERYLAVCRPLHTSYQSTIRRAVRIQILVWLVAALSATPYFYLTLRQDNHCQFDPDSRVLARVSFHVSATIFFVVPTSILCVLYALMAQHLYSVRLLTRSRSASPRCAHKLEYANGASGQQRQASVFTGLIQYSLGNRSNTTALVGTSLPVQSMKKSAFKMLFAVVIAFIICYAPFHLQRLITISLKPHDLSVLQRRLITVFYFISGILYYLGSTINPIFYHLYSRKYREACARTMKRLLYCQGRDPRHRYYRNTTQCRSLLQLTAHGNTYSTYRNLPSRSMELGCRSPLQRASAVDLWSQKNYPHSYSSPVLSARTMN